MHNPDAMAERMPARVLDEWAQFYRVEPFGEWRRDVRSGIIAATMANAWRAKGSPPAKVEDFLAANIMQTREQNIEMTEEELREADIMRIKQAILSMGVSKGAVNIGK